MHVLGRKLIDPFPEFWRTVSPEIPIDSEEIAQGHSSVFGDQGVDVTAPYPPRWVSLPDSDLAYHVAHELTHRVLAARGYPRTVRGAGYPEDSAEARIGADLEEMVLHPPLESLLQPFGFSHHFIQRNMASGALRGIESAPVPEYGSPWHFTWAIRYCLLQLELPLELWQPLEIAYSDRAPEVTRLGKELVEIMTEVGWGSREQALRGMIRARDTLALDVQDKVLVLDAVTGRVL